MVLPTHSFVVVLNMSRYSKDKLLKMIKTTRYAGRRHPAVKAKCPFCHVTDTRLVIIGWDAPEILAVSLIFQHIQRDHPEFVASEKPAEPSVAPKPPVGSDSDGRSTSAA